MGQRLPTTELTKDSGQCVLLPPSAHRKKEADGTYFIEPVDSSYEKGIDTFIDFMKNNVNKAIDECTPEELRHVDRAEYKAAYQASYDQKKIELRIKYPGCTSRDIYMIYHANLSALCNHTDLDAAIHKSIKNPFVWETGQMIKDGNQVFIKNEEIGQKLSKVEDNTLETLFVTIKRHALFINSLEEVVSPEAVPFIQKIKERNQRNVENALSYLEDSLGEPSNSQRDSITSNETLFHSLTPLITSKHDATTNQGKAEMLYRYSQQTLQLTNVGNRLFPKAPVLDFRDIARTVDQIRGEELANRLIDQTDTKQNRQQDAGVTDSENMNGGFYSADQYKLFQLLTGADNILTENDPKLSANVATRLLKNGNFHTLDDLRANKKSFQTVPSVGPGTIKKVMPVIARLEDIYPLQTGLDAATVAKNPSLRIGPNKNSIHRASSDSWVQTSRKMKSPTNRKNLCPLPVSNPSSAVVVPKVQPKD